MNRGIVAIGMAILAFGYSLFWYLFNEGLITFDSDWWIWVWGVSGSMGLIITAFGVISGRTRASQMPPRFCVHCGRGINFNQQVCPHCGIATNPPGAKTQTEEDSLARRLGKIFGKSST